MMSNTILKFRCWGGKDSQSSLFEQGKDYPVGFFSQ